MRPMGRALAIVLLALLAAVPAAGAAVRVPAGVKLQRYAKGIPNPSNLAFDGRGRAYSGFDGRRFARSRVVVEGLPVGRPRVASFVAGPAGRLYLGIGSES